MGIIKIADFGTIRIKTCLSSTSTYDPLTDERTRQPGTEFYQAPEVFCYNRKAQFASDIWSLCLTLTKLFTRRKPWSNSFQHELLIEKPPGNMHRLPEEVKPLLAAGLSYNRKDRPKADYLYKEFQKLHIKGFSKRELFNYNFHSY